MDRAMVYDGEQLNASDVAWTNIFAMTGIGKLAKAVIGAGPSLNDLTCVPTSPASLSVLLNPGEIYHLENVDNSDFGPIPTNTAQQIVKCGELLAQQTLTFTAPVTAGQSIAYLIQVQYQDSDTDPESRPFYLASPATVDTIRRGILSATIKPGLPATTGTQVPPSPDSGYTGAWVVTVANGQTQIISGDIAAYSGAPFLIDKLQNKISQAQGDVRYALSASFLNSVAANGYQKFPGGLIMQWGTVLVPFTGSDTQVSAPVTFPLAFPAGVFSINTTYAGVGSSATVGVATFVSPTTSGFTAWVSGVDPFGTSGNFPVYWMAIGH